MLKLNKAGAVAIALLMAAGGSVAGGTAVFAAAPDDGTTPIVYDNRTILPDSNGQYGIIIPTGISFSDDSKTADASVEITGINGYDLDRDWSQLKVTASVASTNGYKLKSVPTDAGVDYKLKMDGNTDAFQSTMATPTAAQAITDTLGIGTGNKKKAAGTATLTGSAKEKGRYTDTLTYSFAENENTLK